MVNDRGAVDNWLVFGSEERPVAGNRITTGVIEAALHDASLRHVTVNGEEVAESIYVAVRDEAWNTIPGSITKRNIDVTESGFELWFELDYVHGEVDMGGTLAIEGADQTVKLSLNLKARSPFSYARIGFNIVHPRSSHKLRSYRATGPRGDSQGEYPRLIEPIPIVDGFEVPLIGAFNELRIQLVQSNVVYSMSGDEFETEDQRNFGDDSYKTFSTPLNIPIPIEIKAGEWLEQRMELQIEEIRQESPPTSQRKSTRGLAVEQATVGRLPSIGLMASSIGTAPHASEVEMISRLRPAHLRVDIGESGRETLDESGLREAQALGVPVELAATVSQASGFAEWFHHVLTEMDNRGLEIARIIALTDPSEQHDYAPTFSDLRPVRDALNQADRAIPVLPGVRTFFSELNRSLLREVGALGVAAPFSPTVHTWEDEWIFSNLNSIPDLAATAQERFGRPLHLTPVGLATSNGPWPRGPNRGLPPQVDPRQLALVGASWTAAFIASAAYAGVISVTLFETLGPRGVAEHAEPTLDPRRFPSQPASLFPLGYVLATLAGASGAPLLQVSNDGEDDIVALAYQTETTTRVLLSNSAPETHQSKITVGRGQARWRTIDQGTMGHLGDWVVTDLDPDGALQFDIGPYAVIDVEIVG
jgi:D-apionolactonase